MSWKEVDDAVFRIAALDEVKGLARSLERLNHGNYRVMDILYEDAPLTAGDLAARAGVTGARMAVIIRRLLILGLARTRRDKNDQRKVLVSLTKKGEEEIEGTRDWLHKSIRSLFNPLDKEEREWALRIANKVGRKNNA